MPAGSDVASSWSVSLAVVPDEDLEAQAARFEAAALELGARLTADYNAPRDRSVVVRIGPHGNLAAAEGVLRRVLGAGCVDGRIIIE